MNTVTGWGTAIWTSLTNALSMIISFIPRLIGFIVILIIGWIVAKIIEKFIAFLLRKVGFNGFGDRIGMTSLDRRMGIRMDPSGVLARIIFWLIFLVFLVPAVDTLGFTSISNLLSQVIAYIPNVLVAIVILCLGTLVATLVDDLVRGAVGSMNIGNPNLYANIARYAIIAFTVLIALEQLQVAPGIINILLLGVVGALALAFGLAFGLGGRDNAARLLAHSENRLTTAAAQRSAQPGTEQPKSPLDLPTEQIPSREYTQPPLQQQPYPRQPYT